MDLSEVKSKIDYFEEQGLGWYQNIDLKSGLQTKSRRIWGEDLDHPRKRFDEVATAIPEDLTGMSVLDIGCNAGFFSFEAKDRGAEYVCGVDLKSGYIDQAKFCAEVRDQEVDFLVMDIYNLDRLGRTFDLVLCVGILYHCNHLMLAIEQASAVADHTIIIETAIHPHHEHLPLVRYVQSSKYGGAQAEGAARLPGHWHPNMTALKAMFDEQGFNDIEELFSDEVRGGIVAHRIQKNRSADRLNP